MSHTHTHTYTHTHSLSLPLSLSDPTTFCLATRPLRYVASRPPALTVRDVSRERRCLGIIKAVTAEGRLAVGEKYYCSRREARTRECTLRVSNAVFGRCLLGKNSGRKYIGARIAEEDWENLGRNIATAVRSRGRREVRRESAVFTLLAAVGAITKERKEARGRGAFRETGARAGEYRAARFRDHARGERERDLFRHHAAISRGKGGGCGRARERERKRRARLLCGRGWTALASREKERPRDRARVKPDACVSGARRE